MGIVASIFGSVVGAVVTIVTLFAVSQNPPPRPPTIPCERQPVPCLRLRTGSSWLPNAAGSPNHMRQFVDAERAELAKQRAADEQRAKQAALWAEVERAAKQAAQRAENERVAKQAVQRAENERVAKEAAQRAENERVAKEAAQRAENERVAKEAAQRAENERAAKEAAQRAENERAAKEAALTAERTDEERIAKQAYDEQKALEQFLSDEAMVQMEEELFSKEPAELAEGESEAPPVNDKPIEEAPVGEEGVPVVEVPVGEEDVPVGEPVEVPVVEVPVGEEDAPVNEPVEVSIGEEDVPVGEEDVPVGEPVEVPVSEEDAPVSEPVEVPVGEEDVPVSELVELVGEMAGEPVEPVDEMAGEPVGAAAIVNVATQERSAELASLVQYVCDDHDDDDDDNYDDDDDGTDGWMCLTMDTEDVVINPLLERMPQGMSFASRYHVGVLGVQGTGKTTLCNLIRATTNKIREKPEVVDLLGEKGAWNATVGSAITQIVLDACRAYMDGPARDRPAPENDWREPTAWPVGKNMVLWDVCGSGVRGMSSCDYIDRSGLAFMSCVVVTVSNGDSEATNVIIEALHARGIPFILVQTHVDEYLRGEYLRRMQEAAVTATNLVWDDNVVSDLLVARQTYLRETYRLNSRDHVMCVNATPWTFPAASDLERISQDTYELIECILHIFRTAVSAHQP